MLPYIGTSLTLEAAYAQVRLHFNQKELLALKETGGQVLNADEFQLYTKSSADMSELPDGSIDHIVTSPPYMGLRQFFKLKIYETLKNIWKLFLQYICKVYVQPYI